MAVTDIMGTVFDPTGYLFLAFEYVCRSIAKRDTYVLGGSRGTILWALLLQATSVGRSHRVYSWHPRFPFCQY